MMKFWVWEDALRHALRLHNLDGLRRRVSHVEGDLWLVAIP